MFREKNSRIARAGLDPGISELQSSPPKPRRICHLLGKGGRGRGGLIWIYMATTLTPQIEAQNFGRNVNGRLFDWKLCFNWKMSFHFYWAACVINWARFFLLAQIALWRVQGVRRYKCMRRMRKIDQRTSAEYIRRSSKRLKAISNLSSVEVRSLKDGKSTFWKWYSSWTILCERPIYKRTHPSESLSGNLVQ